MSYETLQTRKCPHGRQLDDTCVLCFDDELRERIDGAIGDLVSECRTLRNLAITQEEQIERLRDGLKTIADGELGTIEEAISYANTLVLSSEGLPNTRSTHHE